jgi:hypothetical protein
MQLNKMSVVLVEWAQRAHDTDELVRRLQTQDALTRLYWYPVVLAALEIIQTTSPEAPEDTQTLLLAIAADIKCLAQSMPSPT